jgi:glutamine cyclotransferase
MKTLLSLAFIALYSALIAAEEMPKSALSIVQILPHDERLFTQGLALEHGQLYQSGGLRGQSKVVTGPVGGDDVSASYHFDRRYFAEGLTLVGSEVMVLTWQAGTLFVLDKHTLELKRTLPYRGEGWGLTYDGSQLWLSDGSPRISRRDANTLEIVGGIEVRDSNGPVTRINELEWANGRLYANIWLSSRLIAIDPATGWVTQQWDLKTLRPAKSYYGNDGVANGIAYDPASGHFWLTGKGWPQLFEVVLDVIKTD